MISLSSLNIGTLVKTTDCCVEAVSSDGVSYLLHKDAKFKYFEYARPAANILGVVIELDNRDTFVSIKLEDRVVYLAWWDVQDLLDVLAP